jgi:hypothetical protein
MAADQSARTIVLNEGTRLRFEKQMHRDAERIYLAIERKRWMRRDDVQWASTECVALSSEQCDELYEGLKRLAETG